MGVADHVPSQAGAGHRRRDEAGTCGGDVGVICTGNEVSADNGPAAPKEAVTKLKLGDKEVPLYEYKGAEIPKIESSSDIPTLAVTRDAIYVLTNERSTSEFHLQKISIADGAVTAVTDLGRAECETISSDGLNIYYIKERGDLAVCYDGTNASTFDLNAVDGCRNICAIFGDQKAYIADSFAQTRDTYCAAISKEGLKDVKSVLAREEIKKLSDGKNKADESAVFLCGADRDGFYLWCRDRSVLVMYGPDGKEVRSFAYSENGEKPRTGCSVLPTKDYIVYYEAGMMRVFQKKDGTRVGDIEMRLDSKQLLPACAATDDANHIYFFDERTGKNIYRVDL